MTEVVVLLADASALESADADRVRSAARALAKAVFVRGGRVLTYADAPTAALLVACGVEYRDVQGLETFDRRVTPVIVVPSPPTDVAEDRLFGDEDMETLERFGVVERVRSTRDLVLLPALERHAPIAIFLLGSGRLIARAAEEAARYHRRSEVPLYTMNELPWTLGWHQIDADASRSGEWVPTLGGRPLEGEDAEVATSADAEARLALALETLADKLFVERGQK